MATAFTRVQSSKKMVYPQTAELIYATLEKNMVKHRTPVEIGRKAEEVTINVFHTFGSKLSLSYIDNSRVNPNRKQSQILLSPNCPKKLKKMDRKKGIIPDGAMINKKNGNMLYIEVKTSQKINAEHIKDWVKIASRYNILEEYVLFVIQGKGATSDKINELNFEIAKASLHQYAFAIHLDDFEKIANHWSNQISTDFKSLKILMSH